MTSTMATSHLPPPRPSRNKARDLHNFGFGKTNEESSRRSLSSLSSSLDNHGYFDGGENVAFPVEFINTMNTNTPRLRTSRSTQSMKNKKSRLSLMSGVFIFLIL